MAEAVGYEQSMVGQGRCRKKRQVKGKNPSHYQFASWAYNEGKRYAVPVGGLSKNQRGAFPLISTTIKNPTTQTETLIWIHFDLDFKRADKKWISEDKLDWTKIGLFLEQELPAFYRHVTAVTRSSGGKGLGLVLAISPLELIPETSQIQILAYRLQAQIIKILNVYGMGADEGARGLKRLMPNIFHTDRILDRDEITEALIQKKRPRVLQNLFYALRFHPALKIKPKKERDDLLWKDIRVEIPCARLYTDLLDRVGPWGSEELSAQKIMNRYGMSKNTVYKLLSHPPTWLSVKPILGEGFRLSIQPTRELTNRAFTLLETGGEGRAKGSLPTFTASLIAEPEQVRDGERNQWLVSLVLASKWKGITRQHLLEVLQELVERVPDHRESRSLTRELKAIVRSLYHHRAALSGSAPELVLPFWFEEALVTRESKRLSQKITKKGTGGSHELEIVSKTFRRENVLSHFYLVSGKNIGSVFSNSCRVDLFKGDRKLKYARFYDSFSSGSKNFEMKLDVSEVYRLKGG